MKESLSGRVGRIISGSMNAIVSTVENSAPELVMEEAIREIDAAVDEVRHELGQQIAARHLASKRLQEEHQAHEALAGQIATAVASGRDDLAEAGIARQLDIEAQLPVLEQAIAEASNKEHELEGYVQALLGRKREMREELRRLASARVHVQGERIESYPADGLDVHRYEVLEVDGQRPHVGTLEWGEGDELLLRDNRRALPIHAAPEALREHVGAKVWIVGEMWEGRLRLSSYGIIRPAEASGEG